MPYMKEQAVGRGAVIIQEGATLRKQIEQKLSCRHDVVGRAICTVHLRLP